MKDVEMNRIAGPFEHIPFDDFIQSPIGLVPKAGGKTRLIFHLSFNFDDENNRSLNHFTPKDLCSMKYRDLDFAVCAYLKLRKARERMSAKEGNKTDNKTKTVVFSGKTDVQSVFRLAPLKRKYWKWLIMKAQDPMTGKWMFFVTSVYLLGLVLVAQSFSYS